MGSGHSGLYSGTKGSKSYSSGQAKRNHDHVVSWAKQKAAELEAISKTQREKFNTATVAYDETTGKYYYGRNAGIKRDGHPKNETLFGDGNSKGILPSKSLNRYEVGNCAEVDAINSALNAGAKLENLHITTIHTTSSSMGQSKEACENCTFAFKGKIKHNYTGWHKEE